MIIDFSQSATGLKQRIISGGIALSASSVLARALGVGSTLLTLYVLSVYEFGLYKLVLAAFGLMATFRLGGLDSLVGADAARFRGEKNYRRLKRLFLEYGIFEVTANVALFAVLFSGTSFVEIKFGAAVAEYVRITSFLFLAMPLERALAMLMGINLEFRLLAFFGSLEEAVKLAGVVLLGWWLGWGIVGILWSGVIAAFGRFIFFIPHGLVLFRRLLATDGDGGSEEGKRSELISLLLSHGKWGIATRYVGDLVTQGRYWLIRTFTSTEAVALYALAEGIYGQVFSLVPLYAILSPLVPQEIKNRDRMKRLFLFGIKYGTFLYAVTALAAVAFIPYVLAALFPKYLPAMPLFQILALSVLTAATANVTSSFFFAYREQKTFFFLMLAQGAFIGIFGSILLALFGIVGAAWAAVAAEFFYIGARFLWMVHRHPDLAFGLRELFTWDGTEREFWRELWVRFRRGLFWRRAARLCFQILSAVLSVFRWFLRRSWR